MRLVKILNASLAAALVVSLGGCAGTWQKPLTCAAIGGGLGAIGGGIGGADYAKHHHSKHNDDLAGAGIAAASMIGGAGIGYLICKLAEEEPKPVKRAAAPAPPAPAPVPIAVPAPKEPDACSSLVRLEVTFASDKSDIRPADAAILDETVATLQGCNEERVRLDAYTDSMGSDAYNQALSQRRADSVRGYLISKGVVADRIDAYGLGESNPVASNETAEGRAENRRVEIQPVQ